MKKVLVLAFLALCASAAQAAMPEIRMCWQPGAEVLQICTSEDEGGDM